jgi:hypothetical protein
MKKEKSVGILVLYELNISKSGSDKNLGILR